MNVTESAYRDLPRVDEAVEAYSGALPRSLVVDTVRAVIAAGRDEIAGGKKPDVASNVALALRALERTSGTRIVNASGVLLHTNLGRALWSDDSIEAAAVAARGYTNLEMDIDTGVRSRRGSYVGRLVTELTGAEDCLVVNNNASAVMLALAATSAGAAVPVARGELIEIGGAYRLPDVMEASGARLIEVGTTNRTRVGDYETALQVNRCGAILVVHPSNYRVEGFVTSPTIAELASLANEQGVPLIFDIGSGHLDANTPWIEGSTPEWLSAEPAARQVLEQGADLVMFSGDKLIGGPQAGIVAGKETVINRLRSHPMSRALRVDGVTYAALGATLEAFSTDIRTIPFWRQALQSEEELVTQVEELAGRVGGTIETGASTIGAGSVPGTPLSSPLLKLDGEDHLFERLLARDQPVLTRRSDGALFIDLRTVDEADIDLVARAIVECR